MLDKRPQSKNLRARIPAFAGLASFFVEVPVCPAEVCQQESATVGAILFAVDILARDAAPVSSRPYAHNYHSTRTETSQGLCIHQLLTGRALLQVRVHGKEE